MSRKLTWSRFGSLLNTAFNIRNVSIIGCNTIGKTTLCKTLSRNNGIIIGMEGYHGEDPFSLPFNKETLYFTLPDQVLPKESQGQNSFLIEACDMPSSTDLNGCLRVTDGSVVLLECFGGPVSPMDKKLFKAVMNEENAIVVMFNKMDLLFGEKEWIEMESVYLNMKETMDGLADITASMQIWSTSCLNSEGVVFGSGLYGWGFSLSTFAQLYATKFGIPLDKMLKKLWGEHYFDASSKKWTDNYIGIDGQKLKRGFVQFILDPIKKLSSSIMKGEVEKYTKMLKSLGISLEKEEIVLQGTELFHLAMRKFIPLSQQLLEMVVLQLPSPDKAQRHKVNTLYTGPLDDDCATGIRACKPGGPLMVFISQVMPSNNTFYGIGRIFSGTLKKGETVDVLGENFKMENIQPFVMIGDVAIPIQSVPAGIIVGLKGIGTKILNTATVTDSLEAHKLIDLRRTEPIVSISVCPKEYNQLPLMIESLKRITRIEHHTITYVSPAGENILSSYGEDSLQISLKKIREEICPGIELVCSDPFVSYRETITKESSQICLSKSPNKHNRLYCNAEPLGSDFLMDMETGVLDIKLNKYGTFSKKEDLLATSKLFVSKYQWDVNDSKKIWCFGPEENRFSNVLVDQTRGIQFLNEIKGSICSAFQWATKEGVLCEEPVFGVRFNLKDANLYTDTIHRGSGQVIPTARRVFYASMYTASPAIMEPINLIQMKCPKSHLNNLLPLINQHHGYTIREDPVIGSDSYIISANVPVIHSYKLRRIASEYLGSELNTISEMLDYWKVLGEVLQEGTYSNSLVKRVRERKGLKVMLPTLDCYLDKL